MVSYFRLSAFETSQFLSRSRACDPRDGGRAAGSSEGTARGSGALSLGAPSFRPGI